MASNPMDGRYLVVRADGTALRTWEGVADAYASTVALNTWQSTFGHHRVIDRAAMEDEREGHDGRAVAGLRTAVHALEVIAGMAGPAGDMAATAIKHIERDLTTTPDFDEQEVEGRDARVPGSRSLRASGRGG